MGDIHFQLNYVAIQVLHTEHVSEHTNKFHMWPLGFFAHHIFPEEILYCLCCAVSTLATNSVGTTNITKLAKQQQFWNTNVTYHAPQKAQPQQAPTQKASQIHLQLLHADDDFSRDMLTAYCCQKWLRQYANIVYDQLILPLPMMPLIASAA